MRPSSLASALTAIIAVALSATLAGILDTGAQESAYARAMLASLAVVLGILAVPVCLTASLPARFLLAGTAGFTALGALLHLTVGLPGATAADPSACGLVLLGGGAAIPVLLVLDTSWSRRDPGRPRIYAR
jgi:hypothetical protein